MSMRNMRVIPSEAKDLVVAAVFCVLFLPAAAAREPVCAPTTDVHIKQVQSYVERDPVAEYRHASEAVYIVAYPATLAQVSMSVA
jgi:hypothetical protein